MKKTALWTLSFCLMATTALGATDEEKCQNKKLIALGQRDLCIGKERGKELQGKKFDLEKCGEKLQKDLASAEKSFVCRWLEHGDGTATDLNTGLQWELKTRDGSIHDVFARETWSDTAILPDGGAYVAFLRTLNGSISTGGPSSGCFAEKCDWRLPTLEELEGITDDAVPGCWQGAACTTIPGSTDPVLYWSSTTWEEPSGSAWGASFYDATTGVGTKAVPKAVRAVRG